MDTGKNDSMFDTTFTRPLSDLVLVGGKDMTTGDKIRRLGRESDRNLEVAKEMCLVHDALDTLSLVEKEQSKRLRKKLPEWKTLAVWISVAAIIISLLSWWFPRNPSATVDPKSSGWRPNSVQVQEHANGANGSEESAPRPKEPALKQLDSQSATK